MDTFARLRTPDAAVCAHTPMWLRENIAYNLVMFLCASHLYTPVYLNGCYVQFGKVKSSAENNGELKAKPPLT